jgi:kinase suppressor of Ras 2
LSDDQQLRESLADWNIPFNDLQLKDRIKSGVRCDIYSARWHGDVLVHVYRNQSDPEVTEFLHDVANLGRIRHENVCLFMGACLQAPVQAVVTSELKGTSVYERLHVSADKLPLRSRVSIARQVAQALGYLHAKGIAARCLSSRNIYLDPKVKLSVLDHGMVDMTTHARVNCLSVPRGAMSYLAPEVLRTLRPTVYRTVSAVFSFSTQTDVYAFGTLLYELITGEFPLKGLRLEEFLWLVTSGHRQSLANLACNSVLKVLIERCWTHCPELRPDFAEINHELQNKTGLHKRHSTSQPARLDRYGSGTSRTFCIK